MAIESVVMYRCGQCGGCVYVVGSGGGGGGAGGGGDRGGGSFCCGSFSSLIDALITSGLQSTARNAEGLLAFAGQQVSFAIMLKRLSGTASDGACLTSHCLSLHVFKLEVSAPVVL